MKKVLVALLIASMAVCGLAGCGNNNAQGDGGSQTGGGRFWRNQCNRCDIKGVVSSEPGGHGNHGAAAKGVCGSSS